MRRTFDNDVLVEQVRALQLELQKLRQDQALLSGRVGAVQASVQAGSAVTNLINNSDFSFSDDGYNTYTYTDSAKTLAEWYRLTNTSTSQITENTDPAVSSNALLYDATFGATPPAASWWDKDTGVVRWRKDDAILAPLPKNYAVPGETLFVRFSAKLRDRAPSQANPNNPFGIDFRLRCGIWENLATAKFAEGTALNNPTLTLSPAASPGGFTRHYILIAVNQFRNKASSASVNTTIDVSASTIDNNKYVTVTWDEVKGASQYILYRSEDAVNWYQIGTIPNGVARFDDKGGMAVMVTAPTPSQKFSATYVTAALSFTDSFIDVSARIRVPSNYPFLPSASGKQWLRIDCIDTSDTPVDLGTAELEIDRILLATSSGRWTPSARDNNILSGVEITDPPIPYDPSPPYDPYGYGDYYYGYGGYGY